MNQRTVRRLRAVVLVPILLMALLGLALAIASGDLWTVVLRAGFLTAAATVIAGALRWSVAPASSPGLVAGTVGLWVLSLHGAGAIGGPAVPLVTLGALAFVVLRYAGGAAKPTRSVAKLPAASPASTRQVSAQPTPELCRLWTETAVELRRSTRPDRTVRLTEIRAAVLAELERRDPEGVRRWLDSAPAPTANPLPYVREQHEPPHQAA